MTMSLRREFDDENSIFCRESYEGHKANLKIDVILYAAQIDGENSAE
jgi:hypothetical protein